MPEAASSSPSSKKLRIILRHPRKWYLGTCESNSFWQRPSSAFALLCFALSLQQPCRCFSRATPADDLLLIHSACSSFLPAKSGGLFVRTRHVDFIIYRGTYIYNIYGHSELALLSSDQPPASGVARLLRRSLSFQATGNFERADASCANQCPSLPCTATPLRLITHETSHSVA